MPLGAPRAWLEMQRASLAQRYPAQFVDSTPDEVIGTDAFTVAQGGAPSAFSQAVMRVAARAGEERPK